MAWVNLNDVYVNKTGGTITGDLTVNGSIKVNDGKGDGGIYNVANEITTLRDSVSHCIVARENIDVKSKHIVSYTFSFKSFDFTKIQSVNLIQSSEDWSVYQQIFWSANWDNSKKEVYVNVYNDSDIDFIVPFICQCFVS